MIELNLRLSRWIIKNAATITGGIKNIRIDLIVVDFCELMLRFVNYFFKLSFLGCP